MRIFIPIVFYIFILFYLVDETPEIIVQNSSSVTKIPMRATIISAMSVVPYCIALFAVYLSNQNNDEIGAANRICALLLCTLRCPTIGFLNCYLQSPFKS